MSETLEAPTDINGKTPGETKPAVHKSTRGGYRPGGGRPRKVVPERRKIQGSALPALPPARGGFTSPVSGFTFWQKLTETELGKVSVYVNRMYPLCNPKVKDPTAVKYIETFAGPIPFDPGDYEEFFNNKFGGGDYICWFNEDGSNRMRISVEGLRDFDKYPPKIDWETLLVHDPKNKDFVRWAKTHGYAEEISRLEKDNTPDAQARKEDDQVNASIVEQNASLVDKVIDMSERVAEARHAAAQTPPPPRESPEQKKSLEMIDKAGDAAFRMIEKAIDMSTSRSTTAADPMTHVESVLQMAERITTARGGNSDVVLEMMREDRQAMREEIKELRNARTATAEPPKTFLQQLEEKVAERRLMAELNGDDGTSEKDDAAKPGSIKHMMAEAAIKNLPSLANAAGGIISALFYGVRLFTAKPGEAPTPPPPPPAPAAAAATPALESPEQELLFFLRKIEGAVRKHLNEWDDRDYPGADFADWLINADLDGRMNYDQLRGLGAKEIIERLGMYQPLAQVMQAIPERFGIFVTQFIDRDDIRKKQELDDAADTDGE